MKNVFKKIATISASLLMTGMTAGIAAAANFPAPFVQSGVADVAIVYGTGTGVSSVDQTQGTNIQTTLGESMPSTGGTPTGGDSVLLERVSDKLNLGNSAATVFVTAIDDDNMANLLAEGTYTDDDNTEYDYTQKINLGANLGIEHFQDSDFNDNEPTIGIYMNGDEHVLNYTVDFTTNPAYNASTMETTMLNIMGKEYYVLDVVGMGDGTTNANKTTLLDSANSVIVTDGIPTTVGGKSVEISFISSTEVKLSVDGQVTNSLGEGATYKLSDGTYVGIKDILYDSKDTGISKVEISLGTGKIELPHAGNIELNDETIEEITSFMEQDSTFKLDKIVLQWTTDDEAFIAPNSDLVMPGFESVKISMSGFVQPEQEKTTIQNSGSDVMELKTTIEGGAVTIPLLKADSAGDLNLIGKSSTERLVTTNLTTMYLNETAGDKYLVASWNSTTEAESYYLEFDVVTEDNVNKLRFKDVATGTEKKVSNGSTASFGSVVLTVNNLTRDGTNKFAHISINSGGSFHELYTESGLKVYLPFYSLVVEPTDKGALNYTFINTVTGAYNTVPTVNIGNYSGSIASLPAGHSNISYYQFFAEEDKDSNLGKTFFNVTVSESGTSAKIHVSDINTATSEREIGDTDVFEAYVLTDLATKLLYSTGGDQDSVDIYYSGDQSYAELYVTSPEATTGGSSTLGNVLVKDSEVASVQSKNLIVVGGSCINSVAANLVGGAYCGPSFTTATGVGAGQFLIQSYGDAYATGKVALLVAGYNVDDTVNGATYLRTQTVDTTAGKKYIGTSSSEATLQVA